MLNVSNVLSVTGFFNIHDSLHISIFDNFCFFVPERTDGSVIVQLCGITRTSF